MILSAVVSHVAVTHHAALARTRVHAPNLEKEEETKLSHTREWTVSETACEGRPVVRFLVYSGLTICAALTVVGSVSPWAAAEYRLPVFNDDTKLGVRDKWVVLIEDFAARGHGHGHGHGQWQRQRQEQRQQQGQGQGQGNGHGEEVAPGGEQGVGEGRLQEQRRQGSQGRQRHPKDVLEHQRGQGQGHHRNPN